MNGDKGNEWRDPAVDPSQRIADTAREAGDAARESAEAVGEAARERIDELGAEVAERSEAAKDYAASEFARTADGLEAAARELEGSPMQQDLLREAANGLKHVADAMHGKSLGGIVEEISDFGRRNPVAFVSGAALAGFAVARFARASSPDAAPERRLAAPSSPAGYGRPGDPLARSRPTVGSPAAGAHPATTRAMGVTDNGA